MKQEKERKKEKENDVEDERQEKKKENIREILCYSHPNFHLWINE